MIRVTIVEDHALVREGIATLLALTPDIDVVGSFADGESALVALRTLRPDVAVVDVRLPGLGGIDLLLRLAASGAAPPTIFLTTFDDDLALVSALRAGARGFLLKDVSLERLGAAIRTVAGGGTAIASAITSRVARGVAAEIRRGPEVAGPRALSSREREIVRLIASGFNNLEIAELVHLAPGTVKNHVSNILTKLGARDRTQAVLRAIDLGWV